MKFSCSIGIFLNSGNLICQSTDISKCFREFLRLRDNESQLYMKLLFGNLIRQNPWIFCANWYMSKYLIEDPDAQADQDYLCPHLIEGIHVFKGRQFVLLLLLPRSTKPSQKGYPNKNLLSRAGPIENSEKGD